MAEPSSLSSGEMQSSTLDPICSQKSTEACVDPAFLDSIAQSKHQVPLASSQAPEQVADAASDASLKDALSQDSSTTGQKTLVDTPDSSQTLASDSSAPALDSATAVEVTSKATSKDTSVHQAPLSEVQSESLSHSTTVSDISQSQSQDSAAAAVESVSDSSEIESASASSSSSASLSESAAALAAFLGLTESAVTTSKVADGALADSKAAAEIDASQSDMGQALEAADTAQKTVAADAVQEKEASHKVEQSEPSQSLLGLAVEAWRFTNVFDRAVSKLEPKEQTRYQNQKQWFVRNLHEALQQSDLRFVDVTGQIYEPGMAVTPINLDECSPDQVLIVERMLEPIIMHQDQLLKMGTVSLCPQEPETKPEDVAETRSGIAEGSAKESANQSRVSEFVAAQVYPFQSSDANLSASTVKTPQVTQVIKTANLPLVEEHSGLEAVPQAVQQPGVAASHLASEALAHEHDSKSDQSSCGPNQSVHDQSSHDTSKDLKINVAAFISNKEIFLP